MTNKEFVKIANSITFGGVSKQFKEHSHQKIDDIKEMQKKHARDLIQPRENGNVKEDYVQTYGAKNLNVTEYDIKHAKESKFSDKVVEQLNKRHNENNENPN